MPFRSTPKPQMGPWRSSRSFGPIRPNEWLASDPPWSGPGSHPRQALTFALEGARQQGAETQLIDLTDYDLPFCDGSKDAASYAPDVAKLRREIGAAMVTARDARAGDAQFAVDAYRYRRQVLIEHVHAVIRDRRADADILPRPAPGGTVHRTPAAKPLAFWPGHAYVAAYPAIVSRLSRAGAPGGRPRSTPPSSLRAAVARGRVTYIRNPR